MHRGLIGCFSDLEINNEIINLTKYINYTNNNIAPKAAPCSTILSTKRDCLCEHHGECRLNNVGIWSCDCSKTGYTGRRCEQIAYHLDLNQIHTFEFNTSIQWSEQMNDIAFGLQVNRFNEELTCIDYFRLLMTKKIFYKFVHVLYHGNVIQFVFLFLMVFYILIFL